MHLRSVDQTSPLVRSRRKPVIHRDAPVTIIKWDRITKSLNAGAAIFQSALSKEIHERVDGRIPGGYAYLIIAPRSRMLFGEGLAEASEHAIPCSTARLSQRNPSANDWHLEIYPLDPAAGA